jgi:dTDP-4-amino-4,6-dideoxygalactose transaminase
MTYITTSEEIVPYFPTFARKTLHMQRYRDAIVSAYDEYGGQSVVNRAIVNQIMIPAFQPQYPDHPNWNFTASGSTAFQAVISAVTEPGDTIYHPVYGWCALPGIIMGTGRKMATYPISPGDVGSWIDTDWLRKNHKDIKVLVLVHLWGDIQNVKEVREIVGPDTIIIEDVAQCPSIGENMEFETGKYSDFLIFSFGMFKSPGSIEEGGGLSYKSDKYKPFFEAYFSNGITREMISNTEVMKPICAGTKEYMSIAEAAACVEDMKILKEYGVREQRTKIAKSFYEALGPISGVGNVREVGERPNNRIYFNCPLTNLSSKKHKELWDAKVQIRELPDFRNVYKNGPTSSLNYEYPDWHETAVTIIPCHEYIKEDKQKMICDILAGA